MSRASDHRGLELHQRVADKPRLLVLSDLHCKFGVLILIQLPLLTW